MHPRDFFPLGIASGAAFCNRKQETAVLTENILHGKHTLLMATRRYGKSSLALQALKSSKLPYIEIDFYMARNEQVIETYLLSGIVDLIGKALGPLEKLLASIKKYVKHLQPKLDIGANVFKLELTSAAATDPASNIKEGLLLLEQLLAEKQKSAVLLLDEFQNVGTISQGKGIEGAIRHVAQKTRYLMIIFSGSNRKLLKTMFEDATRPLYKLCWKLNLQRIAMSEYQPHLQKAAKLAWNQPLDETAFNEIMLLTERHPFYVNKLCDRLWTYFTKPPTPKDVSRLWSEILAEEKSDAVKEISLLSIGQKNVLLQIAQQSGAQMTSKETIIALNMSSSSIITALEGLEEKDVISKEDNYYLIISPVVKFYVLVRS